MKPLQYMQCLHTTPHKLNYIYSCMPHFNTGNCSMTCVCQRRKTNMQSMVTPRSKLYKAFKSRITLPLFGLGLHLYTFFHRTTRSFIIIVYSRAVSNHQNTQSGSIVGGRHYHNQNVFGISYAKAFTGGLCRKTLSYSRRRPFNTMVKRVQLKY